MGNTKMYKVHPCPQGMPRLEGETFINRYYDRVVGGNVGFLGVVFELSLRWSEMEKRRNEIKAERQECKGM